MLNRYTGSNFGLDHALFCRRLKDFFGIPGLLRHLNLKDIV